MRFTSRERVLCALNHEEPDRVPIFFGTSGVTTLLAPIYERLKAFWQIKAKPRFFSEPLQYALLDEEAMERLGSDGRPVLPGPAPSQLARRIAPDHIIDGWGIAWQQRPGCAYFEMMNPPLQNATIADLEAYPWPDLCHISRFDGIAKQVSEIQHNGYAAVLSSGITIFEQACLMRGMETILVDFFENPEFVDALLGKLADLACTYIQQLFRYTGRQVDVIVTGDDLGTQNGPIVSPALYRKMIKPYEARVLQTIKEHSNAKIFFHSCGDVYPLIGDLIEIGVDILNPVQVAAGAMADTAMLKREFGAHLSFCGGIDTQWVLPHGRPADVRREVYQRIRDLAPGGGYICAPVHCIQPDVPLINLLALCEEALLVGRYPATTLSAVG
jgi:uroporphyrinogen decarboxylase